MAIAIVGTPQVNGVTNASSIAVTITGVSAGNCLVTGVSILQGSNTAQAVITPTDTNGTWVDTGNRALELDTTNAIRHGVMSAIQANCNAGSHTVTYSFPNGSTYAEMFVAEFSGLATASVLDIIPSGTNASTYLTEQLSSITSPLSVGTTATLAQADELVVAISSFFAPVGQNPQNVQDPPTGYTKLHVQQDTTTTLAAQMSYKIVSATTGVSVAWSVTTSNGVYDVAGTLFTLKMAGGAPPATIVRQMMAHEGG